MKRKQKNSIKRLSGKQNSKQLSPLYLFWAFFAFPLNALYLRILSKLGFETKSIKSSSKVWRGWRARPYPSTSAWPSGGILRPSDVAIAPVQTRAKSCDTRYFAKLIFFGNSSIYCYMSYGNQLQRADGCIREEGLYLSAQFSNAQQ